jgi:hypothetical protein
MADLIFILLCLDSVCRFFPVSMKRYSKFWLFVDIGFAVIQTVIMIFCCSRFTELQRLVTLMDGVMLGWP